VRTVSESQPTRQRATALAGSLRASAGPVPWRTGRPGDGLRRDAASGGVRRAFAKALKRTIDVAVSGLLLAALLPALAVLAVIVRLESPGGAFIRCERVGHRGRALRMLKFRKMVDGASGMPLTSAGDPRFTRLGRLLAKYKLDELPQLWHVLTGEMSLVGPRPEDPIFVERHARAYDSILRVRPGIVGLSQLAFADEAALLDPRDPVGDYLERILPQKLALDQLYVRRLSPGLDLRILVWACVAVVLRRPVAVDRRSARIGLRRRERRSG
jgi:lipopolysaccharide/colanic/teichoic acid biosynthesis glycosyltransferase